MTVLKHLQRILNSLLYLASSVIFGSLALFIWNNGTIMYTDTLAFKYVDLRSGCGTIVATMFNGYYFASFATPMLTLISYPLIASAVMFFVAALFWLLVAAIPSEKAGRVLSSFGNIFYHLAFDALIIELIFWAIAAIAVHIENMNGEHPDMIYTHVFIYLTLTVAAAVVIKIISNFTLRLQKVYEENLAIAQAKAEAEAEAAETMKENAMEAEAIVTDADVGTENSEEVAAVESATSEETATTEETAETEEPATEETTKTEENAEENVKAEEISEETAKAEEVTSDAVEETAPTAEKAAEATNVESKSEK